MVERVLHRFTHGLGDAVQFAVVLKHLRHHRPDWQNDVACLRGKHSCFTDLAARTFILEETQPDISSYSEHFDHDWAECGHVYPDSPSTKAVQCIREKFGLPVVRELLHYHIPINAQAQARVDEYVKSLQSNDFVCIHYEGNTATEWKNLSHDTIRQVCHLVLDMKATPVILDWDRRSPLPDNRRIFCPDTDNPLWMGYGTGDAETLAALLSRARLNICIDSGPQKVALALNNPLLAVWRRLHPIHYVDYSPESCWHLVPEDHSRYMRGQGADYFTRNYQYITYKDLENELLMLTRTERSSSFD